jgi:serine/threonine-protein kinase
VPFHNDNYLKVLQMHISEPPRPPRELRPELPEAFEKVILGALAKDPNERFGSISELEVHLLASLPDVAERALNVPTHTPPPGLIRTPSQQLATGNPTPMKFAATPTPSVALAPQAAAEPRAQSRRGVWLAVVVLIGAAAVALIATLGGEQDRVPTASRAHPARSPAVTRAAPSGPPATPPESGQSPQPVDEVDALPARVQLRVASSPPGAAVSLDEKPLGTTPLDITLSPTSEQSRLMVELAGYRAQTRELVLDRDAQLEFALERAESAPPPRKPAVRAKPTPNRPRKSPRDDLGIKEDR